MKLTFCLWILLAATATQTTNVVGILDKTTKATIDLIATTSTIPTITKIIPLSEFPIDSILVSSSSSTPPTIPPTIEPVHQGADEITCNINKDIVFKRLKATNEIFCNRTWDTFLCWPFTRANQTLYQNCPSRLAFDENKITSRECGPDGKWTNNPENTSAPSPIGWTNYKKCLHDIVSDLYVVCTAEGGSCDDKIIIAERTRTLECIGLTFSLCTLLISLLIFCNFRSLRNARTKIHKNLFVAMVIQVIIRLILYMDRAMIPESHKTLRLGIQNTPYLCEGCYILMEYAKTAVFMWMFIEGVYLHSGVTWMTGTRRFPYIAYALCGWGIPLFMTAIWAFITSTNTKHIICWTNYNLSPYYWILEGPRMGLVLVNLFFLLDIIRVLVVKLRQSRSSDLEQLRKAVRAAIVLLPLLGVTNLLYLVNFPAVDSYFRFSLWSYVTHFFTSFQGLLVALIYCFMNGEVRAALKQSFSVYMSLRGHQSQSNWMPRQASMFSGAYNTGANNDGNNLNDSTNRRESNSPTQRHNNNSSNRLNHGQRASWIMSLCFRGQKVLRDPAASTAPETNV